MRVTKQTKAATRQAILDGAQRLFADKGFDSTTTRDIARAAGIASGTLFNYFSTKEAILAHLAGQAGAQAADEVLRRGGVAETLEEDLFGLISAGLRRLRPLRKFLPALLESSLSPLASSPQDDSVSLRTAHLEAAGALAAKHGVGPLSPMALQLYWTLYSGALAFWAEDRSPRQEDTLALIDDSMEMFVTWLRGQSRQQDRRSR
jgi:AcrR family transcriptional regulator